MREGAANLTGQCGKDLQRGVDGGGIHWAQRLETPALGGVHTQVWSYLSTKEKPVVPMQGLPKSCVTGLTFAVT